LSTSSSGPFATFDPEAPDVGRIWLEPVFDTPQLGLWNVSAGEICLAAKPFLGGRSTVNRGFFDKALGAKSKEEAVAGGACASKRATQWRITGSDTPCSTSGSHGRRTATCVRTPEIAPLNAWAWCYRGKAAAAIGELDDARAAYARAIALEREGGEETDAPALLAALG
jgi:hypothetical protein